MSYFDKPSPLMGNLVSMKKLFSTLSLGLLLSPLSFAQKLGEPHKGSEINTVEGGTQGEATMVLPAKNFGLMDGDLITHIDGKAVDPISGAARLGQEADAIKEIRVSRNGKVVTLKSKKKSL